MNKEKYREVLEIYAKYPDETEFGFIIGSLIDAADTLGGFGSTYEDKDNNLIKILDVISTLVAIDLDKDRDNEDKIKWQKEITIGDDGIVSMWAMERELENELQENK